MMTRHHTENEGEETTLTGHQLSSPENGDDFETERIQQEVTARIKIINEDIVLGAIHVANFLPCDLMQKIEEVRRPAFEQNAVLLEHACINVHDTEHQDRDAYMALSVGRAFPEKVNQDMLEAVVAASTIHDIAYPEAAAEFALDQLRRVNADVKASPKFAKALKDIRYQWAKFLLQLEQLQRGDLEEVHAAWAKPRGFPEQLDKKGLDPHARLGMELMESWYQAPDKQHLFASWTDEQKKVAALTIRDHSNGSDYDPFTTPIEAKLLRLVDKLDNLYLRTVGMIDEKTKEDPMNFHRFVPTAIREMDIEIDKSAKKFYVYYKVETKHVQKAMQSFDPEFVYDKQRYLQEFDRAYGEKSLRLAAEVVAALFAPEGQPYDETSQLIVVHMFEDGERVEKSYKPLVSNPVFAR